MKEPSYREIKRLKQLRIKGKTGASLYLEDTKFLETIYFGKYSQWWKVHKNEIEAEVSEATKPFGAR